MKTYIPILSLLISSIFLSFSGKEICDIIKKLPLTNRTNYHPDVKLGFEAKSAIKLNKYNFSIFFSREMSEFDEAYLISQFKISNNRKGIISYSKSVECDHPIYFYSFHIVDDCKIIDTKNIMYSDSHGFVYEISSNFSKEYNILTIKEEFTSEYGMEPDAETDTLTTKTFKIDLKSKLLDTISKKTTYKILKPPTRK